MKALIMFLSLTVLLVVSCSKSSSNNNDTHATSYKVKYTINCTDCEVVYVSDTVGTQTTEYHKNATWSYTFMGKKNQQLLFLAYNTSTVMQGVTATISVNDTVTCTQTNYCPVSGDAFVVDTL